MKWLNFFIDRPVTATVINMMLIVCGTLAFRGVLVDEYPRIIVPKVKVNTYYRNASAETVEKEVTNPIEEALTAVEGIESMHSSSRSGQSEIRLRFLSDIPLDRAVMQVGEQLARISNSLPDGADNPLIKRGADQGDALIYLGVKSEKMSGASLTHFTNTHIKNHFSGIKGVSEVEVIGPPFAMDIALDALAMHTEGIGPHQVAEVLRQNELLLRAGRTRNNEPISLDVVAKNAEDYGRLVIGVNGNVPVHLSDVARVDLIDDDDVMKIRVNGQNMVLVAISKSPDGNNLTVADDVASMVKTVNQELRGQAHLTIESDHSIFVRSSLNSIFKTILEACVLVILIIFLFLRHIRATLVPLVTIPISLVATFFAIKIFGLSINTITMLAMVLAVGLVVDDAIVMLENIFRYREQGFGAMEAAKKGASEIGFAIIAMTCTLMSVFLPLVFVSDITGVVLREFAITLASAVMFSGVVALTLSPMMCARLLGKEPKEGKIGRSIEESVKKAQRAYLWLLMKLFHQRIAMSVLLLTLFGVGIFLYQRLDSRLLPKEDRGIIGAFIPSVSGFKTEDLDPYVGQVEQLFLQQEGLDRLLVLSFERGVNVIGVLKPWSERKVHAEKMVEAIRQATSQVPSINIYPWSWNIGLSALEDNSHERAPVVIALKTAGDYQQLDAVAQKLLEGIRKDKILVDARSDLNMNEKAYSVEILREPLKDLGIDEKAVSIALQTYADRMRPSEFKMEGQRYDVYLGPEVAFDDLNSIYLMTKDKVSVPLSTVAKVKKIVQAPVLRHLDQMRTANVLASLGEGQSLDSVKLYLDGLIEELVPKSISVSFEGAIAMQKKSGKTFLLLFLAGLIFIFSVMAVQFESWLDPLVILFTVPFAAIGGIILLWIFYGEHNLYTQVGMLTLVGLITKHGILLTEFVGQKLKSGMALKEAVFLSADLRFRPIVMTTAATVLGALPLVLSRGAGMEAREAIGLVIVGGMIFGTILTLFFLPQVIYGAHVLRDRWRTRS